MADILIYGKLKNAGGGKLVDYGAVEGAPTLAQSSGDSTTAVMSQKATVETIKSELANMAPFRFFGTAYSVAADSSGNASAIYAKRSDLIFSFDTSGDSVNIDGYGAAYSYDFSTDLYTISLNGVQASNIAFYYVPSSGTLLYYDESYIPVQTLGKKTVSQVLSSAVWESDNHFVYRLDDEQVKLLPKGGAVWQYSDKEYVGNGTNWVLLGFNVSVDLGNVYTKTEADNHFATKSELETSIKSVTPASIGALGKVTSKGDGRVYAVTSGGDQVMRAYTGKNTRGGTLLFRESDGSCRMQDPTDDLGIANKRYVDSAVATALGAAESALAEV